MKRISSINEKMIYLHINIGFLCADSSPRKHTEASLGNYKGRKTLIKQVLLFKQNISLNDPIRCLGQIFFSLSRSCQKTTSQSMKNPHYVPTVCPTDGGFERYIPWKWGKNKEGPGQSPALMQSTHNGVVLFTRNPGHVWQLQ